MLSFSSLKQMYKTTSPGFIAAILAAIAMLGVVDAFFLIRYGTINWALHTLLSASVLLIGAVVIEENFLIKALILSFPNLAIDFVLSLATSSYVQMVWTLIMQVIIVFLVFLYHQKFIEAFIPVGTFNKIKQELKENRHEALQRLLLFSLVGCMKEKKRVIAQAYHVLEDLFKVDRAVIFLADYGKNMLVPCEQEGLAVKIAINPILVSTEFWSKYACEPEKGVLNVISGRSNLQSLRQLIPGADLEALAVMPLSAEGRVIGLVAVTRQKPENQAYLEPELFITFAYVLASAIDNCSIHEMRITQLDSAQKKAQQIEKSFGKYVSPAIVKELVADENLAVLGGKKRKVAIMMVDLRGFTALTRVMRIEYLVQMLNSWFEEASSLILKNHGTIDKYMGDGIMVIFGAPVAKADDLLRAVYTAFRLQDKFYLFQKNIEIPAEHHLGLGVAITSGEAVVGNFGSSHRMEYTAIGEVVNLAARLEKFAAPGEIVVDQATFAQLPPDKFTYSVEKNLKVKGTADQTIYRLTEIVQD